jgi:hypothetical protein
MNSVGDALRIGRLRREIGEHGQIRLLELTAGALASCRARHYTSLLQRIVHDAVFSP